MFHLSGAINVLLFLIIRPKLLLFPHLRQLDEQEIELAPQGDTGPAKDSATPSHVSSRRISDDMDIWARRTRVSSSYFPFFSPVQRYTKHDSHTYRLYNNWVTNVYFLWTLVQLSYYKPQVDRWNRLCPKSHNSGIFFTWQTFTSWQASLVHMMTRVTRLNTENLQNRIKCCLM